MTTEAGLTLAVIKPPHASDGCIAANILATAADAGLHPVRVWMGEMDKQEWEMFYKDHAGKPFFPGLIDHMLSGPSIFVVLRGLNAIPAWREVMMKVRDEYAGDGPDNAVHGSDTYVAFDHEYTLVFTDVP